MNSKKITAIILDMYGVVLKESKGNFIPYTYNYFGQCEHERITRQFKKEKLFTKAAVGELSSDEFLAMLGFTDTQYHMRNYLENFLTLDSEFIPFAEKFYHEYDLILLSNDVSEWSSYITRYYNLNKYFDHKIVSGDAKCRKPDRRIFEITLNTSGKKAEECIFIDNSVENLNAAAKLGISPVLFNRDGVKYDGSTANSFNEITEMICNGAL